MKVVITIALLLVGVCAGLCAALTFVITLYASWRFYFLFWPAKVVVGPWVEDEPEVPANVKDVLASEPEVDDVEHPEFADHSRSRSFEGTYTAGDRIVVLHAVRPEHMGSATDVPDARLHPAVVHDNECIEAEDAEEAVQ